MSNEASAKNIDEERRAMRKVRRLNQCLAGVLILVTLVAYMNSLQGAFVYDDTEVICENPYIGKLWPLSEAVALPAWRTGLLIAGRPVTAFSLSLNHALLGHEPWGYHLVNLLIHIGAGLLLFGIVRRTMTGRKGEGSTATDKARAASGVAFVIALIWMVHPLTTQAVTYVAQRAESLMGLLYVLTLYACIRGYESGGKRWFTMAFFACLLGVGTKEVMATAPVVVFCYDVIFVSGSFLETLRKRWRLYMVLASTWVVSFVLFMSTLGEKEAELNALSPARYLVTQSGVILHYLRLSVWPHPLVLDYNWPATTTFVGIVLPGMAILVLLAVTGWGMARRRWFGFVGAWFFMILAPTSSVIPIPSAAYEHRMYLPLAAVVAVVVILSRGVLLRLQRKGRGLGAVLVVVVAGALAVGTHQRNKDYKSGKTLWTQNVRYRPVSIAAQNGLGIALMRENKFQEAADCFREAIRLGSEVGLYPVGCMNLANALIRDGHVREAAKPLGVALSLVEHYKRYSIVINIYNTAALLHVTTGDFQKAKEFYMKSLALFPSHPTTHSGLGAVLAELGDFEEAVRHAEKGVEIREAYGVTTEASQAYDSLARVLMKRKHPGDLDRALQLFQRAVDLDSFSDGSYSNMGNALFALGRLREAAEAYRRAIALNPRNREAHHNSGLVLKRAGDIRGSEAAFRRAIVISPTYAQARHSLGLLLLQRGTAAVQKDPGIAGKLFGEAEIHLKEAIRQRENYGDAHNNLGLLYLRRAGLQEATGSAQKQISLERAVIEFRLAIAANQDVELTAKAHANLAVALVAQGDREEARNSLDEAGKLQPKDPTTLKDMGAVYAHLGELDKAAYLATQAMKQLKPRQEALRRQIGDDMARYRAVAAGQKRP